MRFCTLASGSNGNSTYISDGKTHILVDVGISNRAICESLRILNVEPQQISAVFVTHEHSDHVRGLATWLKKQTECVIYAPNSTAQALCSRLPDTQSRICAFKAGAELSIGNIIVRTFATPHDTPESVGYRVQANAKSVMIATDMGHMPEQVQEQMDGVDMLLIEANYDEKKLEYGRYPWMLKRRIAGERGHLSNIACAASVCRAVERGTKRVMLGHLSEENNTPKLAYETVHSSLVERGIIPGVDMDLRVAPRGVRGELIVIE